MMKTIIYKLRAYQLVILAGLFLTTSCNKALEQFDAIPTPVYPTGAGIAGAITGNVNDSLYGRIIIKSGLATTLNDNTKSFTMFIPDNNAMIATFGSLAAANGAIASFSAATCAGIVQYNTVGQKFPMSSIGNGFPNYPLTSLIVLDPTQPFVRMNIFPVRGTPYSYVNNIPLGASVDQAASNGIIHHTGALVAPPQVTLKTMIAGEATLSYFRAAVTRADSGSVGLSKFDSLLNYGVTNMTVLAPNDAAFQTLIFGLVYAQVFAATGSVAIATAQATAAVAAGPAFLSTNNVTTALVKGIVAYHLLASLTSSITTPYQPNIRVFSNNIPSTAGFFIKTLVNGSIGAHPGVMAQSTYAGPVATSIAFKGYGTFPPGGPPYSGAAATTVAMDKHAVNGVYHIINSVLLPQ